MIQYIQANRPDYENDKDFKAFVKALPSDSTAKKNETKRLEANRQFLQEAENEVNQLLNKYDKQMKYASIESISNKDAAFKTDTREQIAAIRQKVSQLMKDNDPSIRIAAKAISEKIAEHGAVTESHLKQLTALNQQLSSGQALTEKQLHLLENTLSDSRNLEVRSNAKQLLEAHNIIKSLYTEFQNYKNGKLDQSKVKAFEVRINSLLTLPTHPSVAVAALAIDTEIKLRQLGPHQEPVTDLLKALASTSNQEAKPIVDRFFKNADLTKMDSIKNHLQNVEQSISLLLASNPNNPAIKKIQQAITDFRGKVKAIEEPAVILPPQKTGARQLPIAPVMVVDALNKQTQKGWELRQVTDRGLQSSQVFSAKMTKSEAEKLLTSLQKGLNARVIESASDKNDNRFRVALDTKDGAALLQRRVPLTAPPAHRPLPIAPLAGAKAAASRPPTAPQNPPDVKKDDPKRRTGPSK
ncbi:MAG: hypothetical protein AB7I18_13540 [Candidatus Berkiella sp.]